MATIWINGVPQSVAVGTRLSEVLSHAPHPCGGKGVCGKCRVHAVGALSPLSAEEERHLTAFEIADGMRLSCCVRVEGDCRVVCVARAEAEEEEGEAETQAVPESAILTNSGEPDALDKLVEDLEANPEPEENN